MERETKMTSKLADLKKYKYLVELRDSGATNMFGASPYLARKFRISGKEASKILGEWMKTFDLPEDEQPDDGRGKRDA
jgi:hypothetical protein